jgi:hypothetical protein
LDDEAPSKPGGPPSARVIAFQISLRATFVILNVVKDLRLFFLLAAKVREAERSNLPEIDRKATADPSLLRSSG